MCALQASHSLVQQQLNALADGAAKRDELQAAVAARLHAHSHSSAQGHAGARPTGGDVGRSGAATTQHCTSQQRDGQQARRRGQELDARYDAVRLGLGLGLG